MARITTFIAAAGVALLVAAPSFAKGQPVVVDPATEAQILRGEALGRYYQRDVVGVDPRPRRRSPRPGHGPPLRARPVRRRPGDQAQVLAVRLSAATTSATWSESTRRPRRRCSAARPWTATSGSAGSPSTRRPRRRSSAVRPWIATTRWAASRRASVARTSARRARRSRSRRPAATSTGRGSWPGSASACCSRPASSSRCGSRGRDLSVTDRPAAAAALRPSQGRGGRSDAERVLGARFDRGGGERPHTRDSPRSGSARPLAQ